MRPSIEETMLQVARVLSRRGSCNMRQVGAVILDSEDSIIGTGYNGTAAGAPNCTPENPCANGCRGLHAEMNALARCQNPRTAYRIFITHAPCWHCTKALASTNIQEIWYLDPSTEDTNALEYWRSLGRRIFCSIP